MEHPVDQTSSQIIEENSSNLETPEILDPVIISEDIAPTLPVESPAEKLTETPSPQVGNNLEDISTETPREKPAELISVESAEASSHPVDLFESMLKDYEQKAPEAGQVIQATIIKFDKEGILIDVGIKRDVMIPAKDIADLTDQQREILIEGSKIPVYVIPPGIEGGELQFSILQGLEQQLWDNAEKQMQNGEILNQEVLGHNKGGLIIRYEDLRGFLPFSLLPALQGVRSPKRAEAVKNSLNGKTIDVKITEVDRSRNRLIFSAEAAQKDKLQNRLANLRKGQILTGKVVKLVNFGAFVDLDGLDGLVHISQLDWKKVKQPSEVVKVGDTIEVKVIEVDVERQRVSLSRKAVMPGPWQTITSELKPGDYVEGVVTRLANFGAFVKLPQNVEGLVHSSQIGYSSTKNPQQVIKPGDDVLLKVLEIKPERKRIALSMRQVPIERQLAWAMENLPVEETVTKSPEVEQESIPEQPDVHTEVEAEQTEMQPESKVEIIEMTTEAQVELPVEGLQTIDDLEAAEIDQSEEDLPES